MLSKVNIWQIVRDHLKTFVDEKTGKQNLKDYFLFFCVPIFIAGLLVYKEKEIDTEMVGILSGSLSLFAGLFFSLIVVIFDIISGDKRTKLEINFLRELMRNISYVILLSLITIVFAFISLLDEGWIKKAFQFLTYFMSIHFVLTVVMVLKRMYIFFDEEMRKRTVIKKRLKDL